MNTNQSEQERPKYRFGFAKQFKKTTWAKMELISEPTGQYGQIRKDLDGDLWMWKNSGLRITAMALAVNQN